MQAFGDMALVKRNMRLYIILGALLAGCGGYLFFGAASAIEEKLVSLGLALFGLVSLSLAVSMAAQRSDKPIFTVSAQGIEYKNGTLPWQSIEAVQVYAYFALHKETRPQGKTLAQLAAEPPYPGLTGGIVFFVNGKRKVFSRVQNVMELCAEIRKYTVTVDAVYIWGKEIRTYRYFDGQGE